jgi:hypothetical protein
MTIKVLSGGSFKAGIPKGVMQGGAWKTPQKVWTLQGGVWKLAWESAPAAEPEVLTEIRWQQIAPSQLEFTAWGGSGTYFWDFDGDAEAGETSNYGEKVIVHTYKYTGWKTVTCQDISGNANQQSVKVTVTDVLVKSTWP